MTTSVWLKQEWEDWKLTWDPANYGGVSVLYVPAEMLWVPLFHIFYYLNFRFVLDKFHFLATSEGVWKGSHEIENYINTKMARFPTSSSTTTRTTITT